MKGKDVVANRAGLELYRAVVNRQGRTNILRMYQKSLKENRGESTDPVVCLMARPVRESPARWHRHGIEYSARSSKEAVYSYHFMLQDLPRLP